MMFECSCGAILDFPSPERVKGFIVSEIRCPICGTLWRAYIVKRLEEVGR